MNKTLLKLSSISLILLLLTTNSLANDEKKKDIIKTEQADGGRPVDDAIKDKAKEDYPKAGDKIEDIVIDEKVKLSSINKSYTIKRDGMYFPPYKCFIYKKKNKTQIAIGESSKKTFTFTIKKSLLKVGDTIVITNNLDTSGNSSIKKKMVHFVEILE